MQVAIGLRSQSFVDRVEVWWGASANSQPWQLNEDGPLIAVRVSFTGDKQPDVSKLCLLRLILRLNSLCSCTRCAVPVHAVALP
jgi:hypothetical protein